MKKELRTKGKLNSVQKKINWCQTSSKFNEQYDKKGIHLAFYLNLMQMQSPLHQQKVE